MSSYTASLAQSPRSAEPQPSPILLSKLSPTSVGTRRAGTAEPTPFHPLGPAATRAQWLLSRKSMQSVSPRAPYCGAHVTVLDQEQAVKALEHYYRRTGLDQKSVRNSGFHSPRLAEKGEVLHAAPKLLHRSSEPDDGKEQMISPSFALLAQRSAPPPPSSSPITSPKDPAYASPPISPAISGDSAAQGSVVVQGNVSYMQVCPNSLRIPSPVWPKSPVAQDYFGCASDFSSYVDVSSSQVSLSLVFKC
jgi:hypothetical protein